MAARETLSTEHKGQRETGTDKDSMNKRGKTEKKDTGKWRMGRICKQRDTDQPKEWREGQR
jgi:hypothetical protein